MNNKFNKIIDSAKMFGPTSEERKSMDSHISSYMKDNPADQTAGILSPYLPPVINQDPARHIKYNNSWSALFTLSNIKHKKYMPIIIAIMLILGGGTSLAAQHALPGDALYGVKTVNENIKSAFTFGTEANAKLQAQMAEEKLQEAEALAAKGDISADQKSAIEASFSAHANKVRDLVSSLEAKGDSQAAADVRTEFKSDLDAEHDALINLENSNQNNANAISDITAMVNTSISGNADANENTTTNEGNGTTSASANENASVNANVDAKASVEGAMNSANNKINEVENFIKANKNIAASAKASATAELQIAKQEAASGTASFQAKAYTDAQASFQKAFDAAQKVQTTLNSDLNVNANTNATTSSNINTGSGSASSVVSGNGSLSGTTSGAVHSVGL